MPRGLFLVAQLMLAALLLGTPCVGQVSVRTNVLVILLDDTGTDKLSFYGSPSPSFPPTPTLSQVRQAGVMFNNTYVQPLCGPTRSCVQTGRYTFRTGMGGNPQGYSLPDSEVTLAEMLNTVPSQPNQYACGAFGKWHLTTTNDYTHAFRNGYNHFDGAMANLTDHFNWQRVVVNAGGTTLITETTFSATRTSQSAVSWINAQAKPFFAYVCYNPPHSPYQVPPLNLVSTATQNTITSLGYVPGQDLSNTADAHLAYDWLIEAVDTEIGNLLGGINPLKLQSTTVIILGDNGTPGSFLVNPPYPPGRGKGTVYQLGTKAPLLVSGRHVTQPNSTCNGLVGHVDLWATIAAITGATASPPTDSISFLGLIQNPTSAGARTQAFVQRFDPNGPYVPNPASKPPLLTLHMRGINDGRWKYIRKLNPLGNYKHEVYDLSVDAFESNDLWSCYTTPGCMPNNDRNAITALITGMTQLSGL